MYADASWLPARSSQFKSLATLQSYVQKNTLESGMKQEPIRVIIRHLHQGNSTSSRHQDDTLRTDHVCDVGAVAGEQNVLNVEEEHVGRRARRRQAVADCRIDGAE